ncbi:hypothetical protein QFC21_001066 [Naganishia friedmannii]|uniref:Uncharacterized protein n=1 Tax=Naganishia friedmannii TaxID=89922 RepID=A0ACC2W942_9TREE|nr:hypothetical protein QFC21_001066 [Naganishia friedmannii]
MSRRNNEPSKGQFSRGLTYQEHHVPKFLQQMRQQVNGNAAGGHRRTRNDDDDEAPIVSNRRSASPPSKGGREAIPERPRDGKWARGSDDEDDPKAGAGRKSGRKSADGEEDDEWSQRYGGGDDGPQIVVLNEGKHLTAEQVRKAKLGESTDTADAPSFDEIVTANKGLHSTVTSKRKQPPAVTKLEEPPKTAKQLKREKKKEKGKKGLLSFDDE